MTPTEAAQEVGRITGRQVDRSTISRWISAGVGGHRLRARRCGGRWSIRLEDLRTFLGAIEASALDG